MKQKLSICALETDISWIDHRIMELQEQRGKLLTEIGQLQMKQYDLRRDKRKLEAIE